jgi:hypothetical protein
MIPKSNLFFKLSTGLILAAALAVLTLWKLKAGHLITGVVWGMGIAYFGVLVYTLLLPKQSGGKAPVVGYLPGAVLRYAVMIGVFSVSVFIVKINGLGLLLGMFVGMTASTFFFLNKMRHGATPPSGGLGNV